MKKVLVLCTGNSCRSQIAEGYLRFFAGGKAEVFSAGIEAHGLNPRAVKIMQEDGIDISQHTSKTIEELPTHAFDFVITVCDNALEHCPVYPATTKTIHQNFPDPAKAVGSEDEVMASFRAVRQQIRAFAEKFVDNELG